MCDSVTKGTKGVCALSRYNKSFSLGGGMISHTVILILRMLYMSKPFFDFSVELALGRVLTMLT